MNRQLNQSRPGQGRHLPDVLVLRRQRHIGFGQHVERLRHALTAIPRSGSWLSFGAPGCRERVCRIVRSLSPRVAFYFPIRNARHFIMCATKSTTDAANRNCYHHSGPGLKLFWSKMHLAVSSSSGRRRRRIKWSASQLVELTKAMDFRGGAELSGQAPTAAIVGLSRGLATTHGAKRRAFVFNQLRSRPLKPAIP